MRRVVGCAAAALFVVGACYAGNHAIGTLKPEVQRLFERGKAALAAGRYIEAIRNLTSAVEIQGPDVNLYRTRAETYLKAARLAEGGG